MKIISLVLAVFFLIPQAVKAAGLVDTRSLVEYYYGKTGAVGSISADIFPDGKINALDFAAGTLPLSTHALRIRLTRSQLTPGEAYTLFAISDLKTNALYSGNLEVLATVCDANGANCATSQGPWKNYDGSIITINGAYTVTTPVNLPPGFYTVRFRPLPNPGNLYWSDPAQLAIGTTFGLEDTRNYFIYWSGTKSFSGHNYVYGEDFTTQVGYESPVTLCTAGTVHP